MTTDRGVDGSTADPEDALLGFDDSAYGDAEITFLLSPTASVVDQHDNTGDGYDSVDVSVVSPSGVLEVANDDELAAGIEPNGDAPVELTCSGEYSGSGDGATLTVDAIGDSISVEEATFEVSEVEYSCYGDDEATPIEDVPWLSLESWSADGNDVTAALSVSNRSATVSAITISDATGDGVLIDDVRASYLDDGSSPEIALETDGDTATVNEPDGEVDVGDQHQFDRELRFDEGESASLTFAGFYSFFDTELEMSDGSVTLILFFEDADPVELTLE
ncbi:hypothetical protein [Halovalidus salilacus]|uniref:hypothetical protein n=1 Tax=Halovalidus salilacus TaxID=3075124 RepID=UPI00387DC02D